MAREHTGRRRNEEARRAILAATLQVIGRDGISGMRIETVAREAGVGKQTIYRWWPTRSALVAEAAMERSRAEVPMPDTGSLAGDVSAFLRATYRAAALPDVAPALRVLAAEAQDGGEAADALHTFIAARREAFGELLRRGIDRGELPDGADVDLLCDVGFGVLWYRLLMGHADVTDELAEGVAGVIAGRWPRSSAV